MQAVRDRDGSSAYDEYLLVLGDDVAYVVRQRELAGAQRERDEVVVVDEVVAAERDEHQRAAHHLPRPGRAHQRAQLALVLAEVLQLPAHPDDVHLHICMRACATTSNIHTYTHTHIYIYISIYIYIYIYIFV